MNCLDSLIKSTLIFLLIFTPLAWGAIEIWAFSIMEIGVLIVIALFTIQQFFIWPSINWRSYSPFSVPPSVIWLSTFFLSILLLQMVPLPSEILRIISPKTYQLRQQLMSFPGFSSWPADLGPISIFPFATKIEFWKWLTLFGLFFTLLRWPKFHSGGRTSKQLIVLIILVGVGEASYGFFEFFSGHHYILSLKGTFLMSSVMGTFINRNYFAGYLLLVIPLSIGFLLSRQASQPNQYRGWRHRLAALDGKTLLLGFAIIIMILGLLFSASRMGIISLLLSFSFLSLVFRHKEKGHLFSRTTVLILGLALLWGAWIGLDAIISRFFSSTEDFKIRLIFWKDTVRIWKDFILFGSGLGTFAQIFPLYQTFFMNAFVTHAENDLLQLMAEIGLVGISLVSAIFIILFYKIISGTRSLPDGDPRRYTAIGATVGILALIFHSFVERNLQVPANAFLFTFLWALVLRYTYPPSPQSPSLP
ncbi:MAG: O-antigen ligase family protein [Thermodesulfobacteriota bacterium]